MELLRPSDAAAYVQCPVADADVVEQAVSSAKEALSASGWADCRPRERADVLHRWADLIVAEAEKLGRLESIASTRPIAQSVPVDAAVTAEQIRFFAEFADKEGGDVVPTDGDHLGMILSEPYGVVGAITPWNVPLSMAAWKLGPALAAGNAVILKPSEITPFSTLYLAELAGRAGIPAGIVNVVLGDGATTGTSLVGHPDIAKISFTGSTTAARAILRTIASGQIKPMTLELGGKSPQIVFASADVERAAGSIARAIKLNAGQTCVAGSRVIVHANIADHFLTALRARMSEIRSGGDLGGRDRLSADHLRRPDPAHRRDRRSGRRVRCELHPRRQAAGSGRVFLCPYHPYRRGRGLARFDRGDLRARPDGSDLRG